MNDTVVSAPEADAPQTGIAEYSATERGLAEVRQRLAGRVYDVTTTKGMAEARGDRAELRTLRVSLDKLRKELNEDDQARIALRNTKAKDITARIVELEEPIDKQIKAEEARKEEARQERERAEAERLRRISDTIADITRLPLEYMDATPEALQKGIDDLAGDTLDYFDDVHLPTAQAAKDSSLTKLREMLDARVAAEAEAQRLAAERAELDRQRAEDDARRKLEEEQQMAARLTAEHIQDLRDIPAALVGKPSEILRAAIAEVQAIDPRHPRFGSRLADADTAKVATLGKLQGMLEASEEQERIAADQAERQRQLDAQAAAQRQADEEAQARTLAEQQQRESAERAERERLEAEAAERARQQEEDAIQRATLRDAAQEAHEVLTELGHADHITTRKLAAALAKEPQA
jgi:colicin import membrane protein